jgi:hypothetical protein
MTLLGMFDIVKISRFVHIIAPVGNNLLALHSWMAFSTIVKKVVVIKRDAHVIIKLLLMTESLDLQNT